MFAYSIFCVYICVREVRKPLISKTIFNTCIMRIVYISKKAAPDVVASAVAASGTLVRLKVLAEYEDYYQILVGDTLVNPVSRAATWWEAETGQDACLRWSLAAGTWELIESPKKARNHCLMAKKLLRFNEPVCLRKINVPVYSATGVFQFTAGAYILVPTRLKREPVIDIAGDVQVVEPFGEIKRDEIPF